MKGLIYDNSPTKVEVYSYICLLYMSYARNPRDLWSRQKFVNSAEHGTDDITRPSLFCVYGKVDR